MFIIEDDFEVQIRQEVLGILGREDDPLLAIESPAVKTAEKMAVSQIRQYLTARYDVEAIFNATGDDRTPYIIMITIDILLYHLWAKKAPRKVPEYRIVRYNEALDWLKAVGAGDIEADLPLLNEEDYSGQILIDSRYKPNKNKY